MQCIITLYLIDTVWSLDPCQWCWFIDCWTVNGKHEELGKRCHTELLCAVCTVASEGQNVGGRSAAVLLCPRLGELGPRAHLTMSPVPRPTSVPSGILIYPAFWLQQTCLFGSWVPSNTMWPWPIEAKVYLHAKFRLDPSNRLATIH